MHTLTRRPNAPVDEVAVSRPPAGGVRSIQQPFPGGDIGQHVGFGDGTRPHGPNVSKYMSKYGSCCKTRTLDHVWYIHSLSHAGTACMWLRGQ